MLPSEVIVVDDGSRSPITYDMFGSDGARLKIVRLEVNRGAAAARQVGIEAATGEVIAFLDSDDAWLPRKLEQQLSRLEREAFRDTPLAIACGWRAAPEFGGVPEEVVPRGSGKASDFAGGCWFAPGSTVLIPRWVFDAVGPFDPELRRLEDYDWFLRFGLAGGRLLVEPEIGAIISVGRRSRPDAVQRAKEIIEGKLATVQHPFVRGHFRRTAKAYLWLEMAKAAQNEGRPILMALYLLQSLLLKPRVRPGLSRWWTVRRKLHGVVRQP